MDNAGGEFIGQYGCQNILPEPGGGQIAEENSANSEEMSASAEEMNAQIEELIASAQTLDDLAKELTSAVAKDGDTDNSYQAAA